MPVLKGKISKRLLAIFVVLTLYVGSTNQLYAEFTELSLEEHGGLQQDWVHTLPKEFNYLNFELGYNPQDSINHAAQLVMLNPGTLSGNNFGLYTINNKTGKIAWAYDIKNKVKIFYPLNHAWFYNESGSIFYQYSTNHGKTFNILSLDSKGKRLFEKKDLSFSNIYPYKNGIVLQQTDYLKNQSRFITLNSKGITTSETVLGYKTQVLTSGYVLHFVGENKIEVFKDVTSLKKPLFTFNSKKFGGFYVAGYHQLSGGTLIVEYARSNSYGGQKLMAYGVNGKLKWETVLDRNMNISMHSTGSKLLIDNKSEHSITLYDHNFKKLFSRAYEGELNFNGFMSSYRNDSYIEYTSFGTIDDKWGERYTLMKDNGDIILSKYFVLDDVHKSNFAYDSSENVVYRTMVSDYRYNLIKYKVTK
ncbi:hypothetical protein MHB71_10490 [Paenibacillus sp. FSL H7-0940]|uniref:hypothetical protein n=1 Tax=Paenibacillus sp. FSL H7-0940 TaxID=2921443 RepID=UPI0030EE6395